MATTVRNKIREADVTPTACASCWGQYPERRHVDFNAAYDGPVLNSDDVISKGVTPVQIDDLILCDECLATGAKVLGLEPVDEERITKLEAKIAELTERNRGLEIHSEKLAAAVSSKPEPARQPGRKR